MIQTRLYKIEDPQRDADKLREAAQLLREGKLVAIPTETVYGLAANALDPDASKAIRSEERRVGKEC